MSYNGVLVFGIDLDKDISFLNEYDESFEKLLSEISKKLGNEDNWKFKREYPLNLVSYFPVDEYSEEESLYILSIKDAQIQSYGSIPTVVKTENLIVSDEKIKFLENFCEEYNIPYTKPKWYLITKPY